MKKFLTMTAIIALLVTTANAVTLTPDHQKIIDVDNAGNNEFNKLMKNIPSMKEFSDIQRKFNKQCGQYAQKLSDPATCKALGITLSDTALTLIQGLNMKSTQFENNLKNTITKLKALQIAAPVAVN